jgi:alpha-N-acetylglucosamine transferase
MKKQNDIACLILSYGKKYKKLGDVAYNSFVQHNKNVDTYLITDESIKDFNSFSYIDKVSIGVLKYMLGFELFKIYKYKKVIILGSDTITCSRLDEFLDDTEHDILATLDYPYPLVTKRIVVPGKENHVNADVVCFSNENALYDIINLSVFHDVYHEQGGLNEVIYGLRKYTTKIVDAPYSSSKVLYNVRSKGNICAREGERL